MKSSSNEFIQILVFSFFWVIYPYNELFIKVVFVLGESPSSSEPSQHGLLNKLAETPPQAPNSQEQTQKMVILTSQLANYVWYQCPQTLWYGPRHKPYSLVLCMPLNIGLRCSQVLRIEFEIHHGISNYLCNVLYTIIQIYFLVLLISKIQCDGVIDCWITMIKHRH